MNPAEFDHFKRPHAYIVSSASMEENVSRAVSLAASLLCEGDGPGPCTDCRHCRKVFNFIHPDVIQVTRERDAKGAEKREIYVAQVRNMIADAHVMPNEAARKVYIVRDADTMNISAQNAMLRLLEEPPGFACVILCAHSAASLLPTVRSRCIELSSNTEEGVPEDSPERESAMAFLRLASEGDRPEILAFFMDSGKLNSKTLNGFLQHTREMAAHTLCGRIHVPGADRKTLMSISKLFRAAEQFSDSNVGARHIINYLAAGTIDLKRGVI